MTLQWLVSPSGRFPPMLLLSWLPICGLSLLLIHFRALIRPSAVLITRRTFTPFLYSSHHSVNYFPFVHVERSGHNRRINKGNSFHWGQMADGNKRIGTTTTTVNCDGGWRSSRLYGLLSLASAVAPSPINKRHEDWAPLPLFWLVLFFFFFIVGSL